MSTSSNQICLASSEQLENTTGKQQAFRKFSTSSKASNVIFITMRLVPVLRVTPPQYATFLHLITILVMACKIALTYVIVMSDSLKFSTMQGYIYISVPKNLQSTIYEITSNHANLNENPTMRAVAKIFSRTSKRAHV